MSIFRKKTTTPAPTKAPASTYETLARATWDQGKNLGATHQEILATCAILLRTVCSQAGISPSDALNQLRGMVKATAAAKSTPAPASKRPSTNGL